MISMISSKKQLIMLSSAAESKSTDAASVSQPSTRKARIAGKNALASRMKEYEESTPVIIPPSSYLLVRADGHHFAKYTKGFKKPFDDRIRQVMVTCTARAVKEFNACCGYVESDEITLVFNPPGNGDGDQSASEVLDADASPTASSQLSRKRSRSTSSTSSSKRGQPQVYLGGGRAQKIASLLAGFLSAQFNMLMREQSFAASEAGLQNRLAWFDARCVALPSKADVLHCLKWRMLDSMRNSTSLLARYTFGHKSMESLSSGEMKQKLREHKKAHSDALAWEDLDPYYRYGVIVKKLLVLLQVPAYTGPVSKKQKKKNGQEKVKEFPVKPVPVTQPETKTSIAKDPVIPDSTAPPSPSTTPPPPPSKDMVEVPRSRWTAAAMDDLEPENPDHIEQVFSKYWLPPKAPTSVSPDQFLSVP
eukprot:gb/GEZN01008331.1/.p1 GENE.gb/GEZN01008331.1/~~gb/GEZN01008331.1/.p1  ORF type:complete len:420 (-),score=64.41 gb/GEZN01008331.1/:164-1423(-)